MRRRTYSGVIGRALAAALLTLVACGPAANSVPPALGANDLTADQIDKDALALLPGSAVVLAWIDAGAFFKNSTLGPSIGALSDKFIPIGKEAGFSAQRDVDKVTIAAYSTQGADVAAVVTGRFDASKIDQAVQSHVPTRGGGVIVASQYAGRTVYTVNNAGFTILTPHTAVAGTETAIRRTLDRIKDGHLARDLPAWMVKTLETPATAFSAAADFTSPAMGQVAGLVRWLQGATRVRVISNFHPPGLNVAATLTYGEASIAQGAADGVRSTARLASLLAVTGIVPKLQGLDVSVVDANVEVKFAVDDQALRNLLVQAPQWIGVPAGH